MSWWLCLPCSLCDYKVARCTLSKSNELGQRFPMFSLQTIPLPFINLHWWKAKKEVHMWKFSGEKHRKVHSFFLLFSFFFFACWSDQSDRQKWDSLVGVQLTRSNWTVRAFCSGKREIMKHDSGDAKHARILSECRKDQGSSAPQSNTDEVLTEVVGPQRGEGVLLQYIHLWNIEQVKPFTWIIHF